MSRSRGEKEEYPSHIPQEKSGFFGRGNSRFLQNFFECRQSTLNASAHCTLINALTLGNPLVALIIENAGKQSAPLRGCELRQRFFQQPLQLHALQRLVRLLRQIQRIRLDAVACVQRVERPVVADVLRVVDLKPLIFFEKRGNFIGNLDKGILGVPRVKLPQVCLLYTSPSPRDGLLSRMPSSA